VSIPPTLLLADDSVTIQRIIALTFADQPVRLVVAKDGQDAINRMATDRPDVVLADTNMPCVDGYEVAKWVRQQPHLSTVPVLLLAGATDPVDEQRLHDSGANGVLEKPFEPTHVISRVKELLGMKAAAPTGRLLTPAEAPPARRPPSRAGQAAAQVLAAQMAGAPEPSPGGPAAESPAPPREGLRADLPPDDGHAASGPGAGALGGPFEAAGRDVLEAIDTRPAASGLETAAEGAADVFASRLAAEQGEPAAPAAHRRAGPEVEPLMSDEMMGMLAGKVVEGLRPTQIRDDLQRALDTTLRETVIATVRDSVATETRAAVAEAVQAAVDGSLIGTVRGALNEAVAVAMPPAVASAVAQTVSARVDVAVQESVHRVLPAAVEKAVHEFVQSRVAVLVRDTIEHELRASVVPMLPKAVGDAVREASERLVREEIDRIRGKRVS